MSEQKSRVIYQEVPRDYRTEIPNIIFSMLEQGLITPSDLVLYSVYRRIAGQEGACWVGKRGLEKRCALNHKTITKSKKSLSTPFDILDGKSLIQITPGDYVAGEADTITIIDIWAENFAFKKCLPGPKEPQGWSKRATLRTNHIKKKESIRACGFVHNIPEEGDPSTSIPPHRGLSSIGSSEDFSSKDLPALLALEPEYLPYFRPHIVTRWITTFGASLVLSTVRYFFKVKHNQKIPIEKPEAWMEAAFKKNFAELAQHCLANKEFAEKMKKQYRLARLKINKRYCQDVDTGKEFYYHLPQEVFQHSINQLLEQ